jgi:alanine transaminase
MLQPVTVGQLLVELMVSPPKPGQPSYPPYEAEYDSVYQRLQRQANALDAAFSRMPSVYCARAQGAIYHFPRIDLPPAALQAAKEAGEVPDLWFFKALLESAAGVCVVPGSRFGMGDSSRDGNIWYRVSFLGEEGD